MSVLTKILSAAIVIAEKQSKAQQPSAEQVAYDRFNAQLYELRQQMAEIQIRKQCDELNGRRLRDSIKYHVSQTSSQLDEASSYLNKYLITGYPHQLSLASDYLDRARSQLRQFSTI